MLIDEVNITIETGKGGDGSASFRREKYVPKGGPDGGDGGRGGSIFFRANPSTHTLSSFKGKKFYKAQDGMPGGQNQRSGKSGEDLIIDLPPGTLVYNNITKELIADLAKANEVVKVAKGGRGGLGNVHFKSSTNQAPKETTQGAPGEKKDIKLELKMIADVGLIGFPNAGKSTLLSRISKAEPKIADYPFTTLEPQLGVAKYDDFYFTVADIPGLIEGASQGKGLGHKFLKHIERTRLLVHLIDATDEKSIINNYKTIREELKNYSRILSEKPEIIVLNKIDALTSEQQNKLAKKISVELKKPVLLVSAVSGLGIPELLQQIAKQLSKSE